MACALCCLTVGPDTTRHDATRKISPAAVALFELIEKSKSVNHFILLDHATREKLRPCWVVVVMVMAMDGGHPPGRSQRPTSAARTQSTHIDDGILDHIYIPRVSKKTRSRRQRDTATRRSRGREREKEGSKRTFVGGVLGGSSSSSLGGGRGGGSLGRHGEIIS